MKRFRVAGIFLALAILGAILRFPQLSLRPMHCDEAVHADKFGTLLEEGHYRYSPEEFHGPTLNYLTLLPAWLQGVSSYTAVTEVTLRVVPATFGILLIVAHGLLVPYLGLPAAGIAGLLTAISPVMVFYSRYYIQEMLLVFFTFAVLISAARYLRRPAAGWAAGAGIGLGLMHATKETSIIAAACLLAALALTVLAERRRSRLNGPLRGCFRFAHLWLAVGAGVLVSALFFSSFLDYPGGIVDSVKAYGTYLARANTNPWHIHPWHYYFELLLYAHGPDGRIWTEALILVLAIIGGLSFQIGTGLPNTNTRMIRFLGFYTLLMVLVYSLIPYKTPWCLLGFWHGAIVLAGVGGARLLKNLRPVVSGQWSVAGDQRSVVSGRWSVVSSRMGLSIILALLAAGSCHLAWQAWKASFRFEADPGNPWVYAHTLRDVFEMVRRVDQLSLAHPQGAAMPIQVISRENLWPLPWYLRRYSRIGWWNGVSETAPNAPVILATPDMEPALVRKLYELPPPGERELYISIYNRVLQLRPQVELRGYAAKSLWDELIQMEAAGNTPSPRDAHR